MPTLPTPIPTVPTPPSRTDPANFRTRADLWHAGEPAHTNAMNALATNVYNNAVETAARAGEASTHSSNSQNSSAASSSSAAAAAVSAALALAYLGNAIASPNSAGTSATTSLVVGPGVTRTWATQTGKSWAAGQVVMIQSRAHPESYMVSAITGYGGSTLSTTTVASGVVATYSDWDIFYLGAVPPNNKAGQVLRANDELTRMEWGDEGGVPLPIRSSVNVVGMSKDYWQAGYWTQEGAGIGAAVTGPFGDQYAYPVVATGSGPGYGRIAQGGNLPTGTSPFTISAFVKKGSNNNTIIDAAAYGGADPAANTSIYIDFATGCKVIATTDWGPVPCGAIPVGSGWYRVWWTLFPRASHTTYVLYLYGAVFGSVSGETTYYGGVQVEGGIGPGQYLYTTTTSASGAGPLRRNLLPYGRSIDSLLGWTIGANLTRWGTCTSPVGDMTARAYLTNSLGNAYLTRSFAWSANTQYTVSVYAKLIIGAVPTVGTLISADYDSDNNAGTGPERISLGFNGLALTSDWKRFSLTFTNVAAVTANLYFVTDFANGAVIAIWGAQVEAGPVPTPFIPTTTTFADGAHAQVPLRRKSFVDSTNGPISVQPQVMLDEGDWFEIEDVGGQAHINNITVVAGAHNKISGDAADFVIDTPFWSGRLTFNKEKGLVVS